MFAGAPKRYEKSAPKIHPKDWPRGDKRALFERALCSLPEFGLNSFTPPFRAFFPPPPSIASTLRELKWAITSPKKGQAMQRYHEGQSARSKGARLSPLNWPETMDVEHEPDKQFLMQTSLTV